MFNVIDMLRNCCIMTTVYVFEALEASNVCTSKTFDMERSLSAMTDTLIALDQTQLNRRARDKSQSNELPLSN